MKSGATLWVGAIFIALVAIPLMYRPPDRTRPARTASPLPVATPLGITLQLRTVTGRAARAAGIPVLYSDATGMTLYVSDAGGTQMPSCAADCETRWTPVIAPAGALPTDGFSVLPRADGIRQWALHGAPLYRFTEDKAIGDANGDGVDGRHAAVFRPAAGLRLPDTIDVREIRDAGGAGLVDALGMTLYALDRGAAEPAPCAAGSDCARRWIPLQAPEIAASTGDFTVLAREDGIAQWAYRGQALFKFDGDQQAGDANGIDADPRYRVALIVRFFMPANAAIRRSIELGAILATAQSATLYERDRSAEDENHSFRESHGPPALGRLFGTSTCDEACARTWPPFEAPADARPCGYWDVIKRPDGRRQWAYKGYPLYTYASDRPGEIRGNYTYELGQISDQPTKAGETKAVAVGAGVDPFIPAGGDVAGVGVSALFWHAVVP